MAGVEHWWFRIQFAGEDIALLYYSDEDPDQDFDDLAGDPAAAFAVWRAECEQSRKITAAATSLERPASGNGQARRSRCAESWST